MLSSAINKQGGKIMLLLIIGGAIALVIIIFVIMYNSLISKKNDVNNSFATIDAMLKKRYDLIPNLIATVKTYMKHENDTLVKISELRSKAVSGSLSSDEKIEVDNMISKSVRGIMVAVENYPDLKANQNFIGLQNSLNEIEEQISAARRAYNASVTDLNNAVEMFPTNIIAGMMSLKRRQLFEISEQERKNVDVANLFKN